MYNIMIMLGAQAFKFDEKGCWLFQKKKLGIPALQCKMHGTEGIKLRGRYLIITLNLEWL